MGRNEANPHTRAFTDLPPRSQRQTVPTEPFRARPKRQRQHAPFPFQIYVAE